VKIELLATMQIPCSGETHKVSITKTGHLVFHDHADNFKTEKTFMSLGGMACGCYDFLDRWKRGRFEASRYFVENKPFYDIFLDGWEVSDKRNKLRARMQTDRLEVNIHTLRYGKKISQIAYDTLSQCKYRKPKNKRTGNARNTLVSALQNEPASIRGYQIVESYIEVNVRYSWYTKVYKRGLAVIDGRFVVDVLSKDDNGILVLAGKQGRGYEISTAKAYIKTKQDGTKTLKWVK